MKVELPTAFVVVRIAPVEGAWYQRRVVSFYKRCLPHWLPDEKAIFLTWRLRGSIPVRRSETSPMSAGEKFAGVERLLDRGGCGPLWLKDARVAEIVVESILKARDELRQFLLHGFSVMPNHVHLLITPKAQVRIVTRGIKGSTARRANELLGRKGQPFWQDESFDHWFATKASSGGSKPTSNAIR